MLSIHELVEAEWRVCVIMAYRLFIAKPFKTKGQFLPIGPLSK